uniref:CiGRP1 cold-inducible RNA-binding protein n=1 Tax=Phallusia mammillata TaxID=59560 RepID=A0A6F9DR79_9ASCI|nr:CiGRP1 cold-inducible RNA-binding protein [Phallusia mammillata]
MSKNKLYVGNLSYKVDDDMLREEFSKYGDVIEVAVVLDRDTNRSRGFGFVTYNTEAEAENAKEKLRDVDFHGRTLTVSDANPRGGGGGDRWYELQIRTSYKCGLLKWVVVAMAIIS